MALRLPGITVVPPVWNTRIWITYAKAPIGRTYQNGLTRRGKAGNPNVVNKASQGFGFVDTTILIFLQSFWLYIVRAVNGPGRALVRDDSWTAVELWTIQLTIHNITAAAHRG